MIQRNFFLSVNETCDTHHTLSTATENQYQCRNADVSDDSVLANLRREKGAGEICNYTTWNDPANPDINSTAVDYSRCGFNKDSAGYCLLRKGDKAFFDTYAKIKAVNYTDLNCHVSTIFTSCTDAQTKIDKILLEDWMRKQFSVDEEKGWANYANNDNCVADSITTEFWQSRRPNSAVINRAFSAITMVAALAFMLV